METLRELFVYYSENMPYVWGQIVRHSLISFYGVLFAAIVAIPLGIFISRHKQLSGPVISLANIIQTTPALAVLALLMLAIGLGPNTVVVTLFLYSLLPILKNTYTGIQTVDNSLLESGKAMGMTRSQVLFMVELPLAVSVIMAGLRTALVVGVSVTTIGTFIGAGGLGDLIIRGTSATNGTAIILAGAIPAALLAVLADLIMGKIEFWLSPANEKAAKKTS